MVSQSSGIRVLSLILFTTPCLAEVELQDVLVDNRMPGWIIQRGETDSWKIEDNMLICTGEPGGFFGTERNYTDFILDFEYKLPPDGNSGVFIRVPEIGHPSSVGMEVQILDDYADIHKNIKPSQYNGSLYKICAAGKQVTKPAGQWNRMRVTVDRDHIVVAVNDETVVDADSRTHPEILNRSMRGPVAFQNHSTRLWFRNIRFADLAAERSDRSQWWRDAKFGMFIHWGIYSVIGEGEWIMKVRKIPAAEYEPLAPKFNPVKFDGAEWVRLAKQAGQKYIVITSKHHDGFAMYDSKTSDYDIIDRTPFKRDPLKELADACDAEGMRLGFYHSILDWHHPMFAPVPDWDPARKDIEPDFDKYLKYMESQVRELCTGYGPLACMWWDGSWDHTTPEDVRKFRRVNAMVRGLQPGILINNRGNTPEDFSTPEQYIPPTGLRNIDGSPMQWENCITLTTGHGSHQPTAWWGYDKNETQFKTPEFCIRMLIDVVSKGGNLLLNVGPTPEGEIRPAEREVLQAIGRWLDVNGEAIYGTTASPFKHLPFYGKATIKDDTIYLFVFNRPEEDVLVVPGVHNEIASAKLLATGDRLQVRAAGNDIRIPLPPKTPDPIASVIALKLKGTPNIKPAVIQPDADGLVTLPAPGADLRGRHGQRARLETADGKVHIGNWTNANDYATWEFEVENAGEYEMTLTYAANAESAGGKYEVSLRAAKTDAQGKNVGSSYGGDMFDVGEADQKLEAATEMSQSFASHAAGRVTLDAGRSILAVRALEIPKDNELMRLREVLLEPLEKTGG